MSSKLDLKYLWKIIVFINVSDFMISVWTTFRESSIKFSRIFSSTLFFIDIYNKKKLKKLKFSQVYK